MKLIHIAGNEMYFPAKWAGFRHAGDATTSKPILHRSWSGTAHSQALLLAAQAVATAHDIYPGWKYTNYEVSTLRDHARAITADINSGNCGMED